MTLSVFTLCGAAREATTGQGQDSRCLTSDRHSLVTAPIQPGQLASTQPVELSHSWASLNTARTATSQSVLLLLCPENHHDSPINLFCSTELSTEHARSEINGRGLKISSK